MSLRSRSRPIFRGAAALASATMLIVATPALASATTAPEPADSVETQQNATLDDPEADALEAEQDEDALEAPQSGLETEEAEEEVAQSGEEPQSGLDEPEVASRSLVRAAPTTVTKCEIPLASHNSTIANGTASRIDGADRYATAVNIANKVGSQSVGDDSALFIASGSDYADGLTLGALASAANWPLMLTHPQGLDSKVRDYIATAKPTHIYIGGGKGAVSAKVESQIRAVAAPDAEIKRFDGKNRYETSAKIAECFDSGVAAFVATGQNYADAVIAGAPAASANAPIILANGTDLKLGASAALTALSPSAVHIVGGTWTAAQKSTVSNAAGGATVTVHSGKNRYATGATVAKDFYGASPSSAVYAIGTDFPDALAGGAVSKVIDGPILLTKATCRPKEIEAVSKSNTTKVVLGGVKTVNTKSHTTTCVNPPKPVAPTKTLLTVAKAQIGKPYVSGAAGPNAFDCSGLTQYVYKENGKSIPRTTWQQWSAGTRVASPQAGDIVVMGGGSHVGVYVSPGVMIDAGNPRVGVSMRAIYSTPNAYVRF